MKKITLSQIKKTLKIRNEESNKNTFGHALLVVGSEQKIGAAIIASKACLRSGVGLLTTHIPKEEKLALQIAIPESMIQFRNDHKKDYEKFTAIGIGCGIGTNSDAKKIVHKIISTSKLPLVIDADALNIISSNKKMLQLLSPNTILTPHAKEFDRLFGTHKTHDERIETAIQIAKQYDIIIVLKAHETIIIVNGESFINTTGNAGLAKGGSGDALSGIIVSFLAQGYASIHAAILGVYIHGLAADLCLASQSMESMLITDVINYLGNAFKMIHKTNSQATHEQ